MYMLIELGDNWEDLWLVKYICVRELFLDSDIKTQVQPCNYVAPVIINIVYMEEMLYFMCVMTHLGSGN